MATELQRLKYEKVFERFDLDRDDLIQQSDIDALVEAWAREFGLVPGSGEWRQLVNWANRMWQDLLGHLDGDGNKVVTKAEWLRTHERREFIEQVAIPFSLALFDAGDTDHDGRISEREWLVAQLTSGLRENEATSAFQRLDTDDDGYLTKADYALASTEFYTSDDDSASGNLLAGRI